MNKYYAGMDCTCEAYGQCECGCGADWTDPEIYRLREALEEIANIAKGVLAHD